MMLRKSGYVYITVTCVICIDTWLLVQEYMEKKREARKKKDIEQRYVMQRTEMEKRKKLEVHMNALMSFNY